MLELLEAVEGGRWRTVADDIQLLEAVEDFEEDLVWSAACLAWSAATGGAEGLDTLKDTTQKFGEEETLHTDCQRKDGTPASLYGAALASSGGATVYAQFFRCASSSPTTDICNASLMFFPVILVRHGKPWHLGFISEFRPRV